MSAKGKFVILGMAVLIAGLIWKDARAGNLQSPAPPAYQIYNLELALGQGFTFVAGGSDPGTFQGLVVDDISYTVDLNPCNVATRCLVFNRDFTGAFWQAFIFGTDDQPDPPGGPDYEWYNYFGTGFSYRIVRWAEARGTHFRADMVDTDASGVMAAHGRFDSISHSLYGENLGRFISNDIEHAPHDDIDLWSEVMNTAIAISPTSASRHYQTPYVLQSGYVRFRGVTGAGISAYVNATAYVKGRVFFNYEGSTTPTRNTSFNIVTE